MKFSFICREPFSRVRRNIAVIGAGPAGLTVTGYLVCRGYNVDVYDKLPLPGGLMVFAIPRSRITLEEIIEGWRDLEQNFNVKFNMKTKVSQGESSDEGDEFAEKKISLMDLSSKYDALILATGTWKSRRLGIEGENASNVVSALSFLYHRRLSELGLVKEGISLNYRKVVVIGAGLSAVDAAEECISMGVSEVYMVYRRSIKEAPAGSHRIRELIKSGVKWIELAQPKKILTDGGYARGVEFLRVELGEPDETGRPRPKPIPGSEFILEADLIIVAVGETSTPPIYSGELTRYLDNSGRIIVDANYRIPGTNIYAVGDVVTGPSKIGLAVDHALKAARVIDQSITGERISVSTLLSKLKPVKQAVVERTEWKPVYGEEICKYLDTYNVFNYDKCLNAAPFTRVFDYSKCMGCETCNAVCGFVHDGRSMIKINKLEDGLVYPTACLHCTNASCQLVCKKKAITRGELGEVLLDYKKCNKCLDCLTACPVKAIKLSRGDIVNCDLCSQLRKGGLEPACVSMCPSKAIILTYH